MSLKNWLLSLGLIMLGLAAGAGLMFIQGKHSGARKVASDPTAWRPGGLGKHLAPVVVQILPPEFPNREDQEVELIGLVTLNSATDSDLYYQWSLPEGVSVVDGITEDAWAHVKVGETLVTKISVLGFSREHRRVISLEASVKMGENRLGNSSSLASSDAGTPEAIAPARMKIKQREEQDAEKARRKSR